MNIYQRALQFYLDTRHYLDWELEMFFYRYTHYGTCVYENGTYHFESEIYRTYNKRMVDPNYIKEFHIFKLDLTDTEINRYLTKNYPDGQLAAVIFAHWFGLTKKQIQQIANLNNRKKYDKMLNFFLWNPSVEEYPFKQSYINTNLNQKYYVLDKDTKKKITVCYAVYDNSGEFLHTYLVNKELGLKLKVDEC